MTAKQAGAALGIGLSVWGGALYAHRHQNHRAAARADEPKVVVETAQAAPPNVSLIEKIVAKITTKQLSPTEKRLQEVEAELARLKSDIPSMAMLETMVDTRVAAAVKPATVKPVDTWVWYPDLNKYLYGHVDETGVFRYTHESKGK